MITQEKLKEILSYNPETGLFVWLKCKRKTHLIGKNAGSKNNSGYVRTKIDNKHYFCHRLAWFYMTGKWPEDTIDHINGIKHDNRFSNLRDCSIQTNKENKRIPDFDNKTGYLGVSKKKKRYRAQIKTFGETIHIGQFKTAEEAHIAYLLVKRKIHLGNTI